MNSHYARKNLADLEGSARAAMARKRRGTKGLNERIRDDFAEMNDPDVASSMQGVDFADQLAVGFPAYRKEEKKRQLLVRQSHMFYFWHLAPFARKSISEV